MNIHFKDKDIELKFTLGNLEFLDTLMGAEMEGMNFGMGLERLMPGLQMGNIISVSKVIRATTSHHKNSPKTDEELEEVLNNIIENEGIEQFIEDVLGELGKKLMTQQYVDKKYRPKNQAKK